MKPVCGKCFKVAERNGNKYICPSCGDVVAQVAQIPATLSIEEENELLKKVAESYTRIINDLEEDCERLQWAVGEIERLRTALEEVYEELKTLYFMIDHDEDIFYERKKKYLSIIDHVGYSVAGQVLSATTEPKQDKTCVICGKREGKYLSTANRWFCEPCTDALPPVNANAEKMREGDGNE